MTPERAVAIRCCDPFFVPIFTLVWRKPFAEKASQIGKIDPNAIRWFDRLGRQHAIKDINRPAGDITSVANGHLWFCLFKVRFYPNFADSP